MIVLTCEVQEDFTFNYIVKGFGATGYLMSVDQLSIFWNRCGRDPSCFPQKNESLVWISTQNSSFTDHNGSVTYHAVHNLDIIFFIVKSNDGMQISSNLYVNISIEKGVHAKKIDFMRKMMLRGNETPNNKKPRIV